MKNEKLNLKLEEKARKLQELAKELKSLLPSELEEAEGGCWTCDSYCKKHV